MPLSQEFYHEPHQPTRTFKTYLVDVRDGLCWFVVKIIYELPQVIRQSTVALVYEAFFLGVHMAGKLVDKGFYAGEAFVKARVETAGAFGPVVSFAVGKEA